jgi:hypothetical protein
LSDELKPSLIDYAQPSRGGRVKIVCRLDQKNDGDGKPGGGTAGAQRKESSHTHNLGAHKGAFAASAAPE